MVRWTTNKRRQRTKSSRRSDNSENWGPWANLPVDPLASIMRQLNIVDTLHLVVFVHHGGKLLLGKKMISWNANNL